MTWVAYNGLVYCITVCTGVSAYVLICISNLQGIIIVIVFYLTIQTPILNSVRKIALTIQLYGKIDDKLKMTFFTFFFVC